jgi:hypothetical protein
MTEAAQPFATDPRQFLRHTLATLAYRGAKVLRDVPPEFAGFQIGDKPRTPLQILAHLGDLLAWALSMADGRREWHEWTPPSWSAAVHRFFAELRALDEYLASGQAFASPWERLFQGPVADALTHVGQLAMLRRLAGCPMKGENYFKADIVAGRVGPEQAPPKFVFD